MENVTECRVCGRELKTPRTVAAGIGPVCARKEREGREEKGRQFRGKVWQQQGLFDQVGGKHEKRGN